MNNSSSRWLNFCTICVAAVLIPCLAPRCGLGQAVVGQPFGVASIPIPVALREPADRSSWKAIDITERQGRVHYPAIRTGILPGAADDDGPPPSRATLSFLFVGSEPLELTIGGPEPIHVSVVPVRQPGRVFRRQLTRWWRDYNATVRQATKQADYPGIANVYLTSMLANRLGLEPPLLSRNPRDAGSELQQTLELLSGAEGLREHLVREMMRSPSPLGSELPAPADIDWLLPQPEAGPADPTLDVEPMAWHVPAECFYLRFGQFSNYLWLNRLLRDHGGDLSRMISLRGQDPNLNERLQDQLALHQGKLAEIFGDQVIADVAIIGRDLYMAEGAAIGVLFHAKNNLALSADLRQQRKTAQLAAKDEGSALTAVEIGGQTVSYLSTPSGRLHSYYAVDGDFHLVTTSESIVRRFFEAGNGESALGASFSFQAARQEMPADRDDTLFGFFSRDFFQSLLSPQYQIGLRRRLQADNAIVLVQLAELAAKGEGHTNVSLDGLIAAGFLPVGFGRIADGSGPILTTGEVIDSLRGSRGSFTPIPDLPLNGISREEAEWYARVAGYFQQNWQQMDPLVVSLRREQGDRPDVERIVLDANISPIAEEKYGWILSLLGPPTTHELRPTSNDIITMQAMVKGDRLSNDISPHHLFLGIKDSDIPVSPWPTGLFQTFQLMRIAPAYLGAWPKLGFLDLLPLGLGGVPDRAGFAPLPLGAWRWQGSGFSVVSFQQGVLGQTVPELEFVPTDSPAQIRVHVGDLSSSHLANFINVQNYQRAFQASVGNVRLIRQLTTQLKVPGTDARQVAERLLNTQLVCALGGEYEFDGHGGELSWRSTAWPAAEPHIPDDYFAPIMSWFRGADLELIKSGDRLVMHAQIDMHRDPKAKPAIPFFDLFKGVQAIPNTE